MNTYNIVAISLKKTITKRVSASTAKYAEKKYRRNHRTPFEEVQITRVTQAQGGSA